MSWGEAIAAFVIRWRVRLFVLLGALVALAAVGIRDLGVDNAVEIWFLDDDPALQSYRHYQETFGNDEVVVLALEGEHWLSADGLVALQALTKRIDALEGIARVQSILTLPSIRGDDEVLDIGPAIARLPLSPEEALAAKLRILADPLLAGKVVSRDGATVIVLAQMESMSDIDARRDGILEALSQTVAEEEPAVAGIGVVYSALNVLSTRDGAVFVLVSNAVILLLLWFFLGRLLPSLAVLGAVGLSSFLVMGCYAATGHDINMVTMVLPTLVLVIGVIDCVHLLTHIADHPEPDRARRIQQAVGFLVPPLLFNMLTTTMGFLSLVAAPMGVLRQLGLFSALGMVVSFGVAILVCCTIAFFPAFDLRRPRGDVVGRALERLADAAIRGRTAVLFGAAVLALVAALGITKLVVDTYSLEFLPEDHAVRQDSATIERAFGPYTPLELVVRSPGGVKNPETFAAMARWQDRMERDPGVGSTRSAADVVRRLHQVLSTDHTDEVPTDPLAFDQLLLLYESDPEGDLRELVSADGQEARVAVSISMGSATELGGIIDGLVSLAHLPDGATVEPSGYLPLYVRMMTYIVTSQINSFALAFIVIFSLIALLFRSIRMAAFAIPTNLLPVLFVLGLMGFLGIRLDVATVTISSIVLGLVVDDSILFLHRFRHELTVTGAHEAAVRATVRGEGRAITITTLVLGLGFSVLGLASIQSVASFGLLLAATLVCAAVVDLAVTPALLVTFRPALGASLPQTAYRPDPLPQLGGDV